MENIHTHAMQVVGILKKKNLTISAAESCTGGLFAKLITDCPGASSVLGESYVTYSPEAKIRILGVKKESIASRSVVSSEVAKEMAEGVKEISGADIGVSFTGYAGPDGEDVGLVFSAISYGGKTIIKELKLSGDRNTIRNEAVELIFLEIENMLK